ncbi:carbon storage regulator [Benzoatithermus flavus]|uniref:Translational regulator CsrA n=1 Tax=Benzoatithermus flavus TaxID=3108223 RepID=A0ABU8XXY1_9PROT
MLNLTRRVGEAVIINNAIEVRVLEVRGRAVRLGFRFPPEATVLREELFLLVRRENEAAARAASTPLTELELLLGPLPVEPDERREPR